MVEWISIGLLSCGQLQGRVAQGKSSQGSRGKESWVMRGWLDFFCYFLEGIRFIRWKSIYWISDGDC